MKKYIQNRARELRLRAGLTAEETAIRADTSSVQIYRLEKGEREMTFEWMSRLSQALNCKPYEILPHDWQPIVDQEVPESVIDYICDIQETVDEWLRQNKKELDWESKKLLVKSLYEETVKLPQEERKSNIVQLTNFLMKNKAS